jgi:hypothetical protein
MFLPHTFLRPTAAGRAVPFCDHAPHFSSRGAAFTHPVISSPLKTFLARGEHRATSTSVSLITDHRRRP